MFVNKTAYYTGCYFLFPNKKMNVENSLIHKTFAWISTSKSRKKETFTDSHSENSYWTPYVLVETLVMGSSLVFQIFAKSKSTLMYVMYEAVLYTSNKM